MTDDDAFAHAVEDLVPTHKRVDKCADVEQRQWDLLVTTKKYASNPYASHMLIGNEPASHLHIVSFCLGPLGNIEAELLDDVLELPLHFSGQSRSTEYKVPGTLPSELQFLVESSLLPAVQRRGESGHTTVKVPTGVKTPVTPLLRTTLGDVLACLWTRPGGAQVLALPPDVGQKAGWVKAALKFFRTHAPDRFAEIRGWEERHEWSTADERTIRDSLTRVAETRQALTRKLDAEEQELRSALTVAESEADTGLRRLLTLQGTDLEVAVTDALRHLGFDVTVTDDQEGREGNRADDLRVRDPDAEGWEALVEVKGYRGGAKVTDLSAITRHVLRYVIENGDKPSSVWWVANQFADQDPELRQPVLSTQDDELRQWADEINGVSIDTSDLFRLVVAVDAGALTAPEARRLLRTAKVRYAYGPTAEES